LSTFEAPLRLDGFWDLHLSQSGHSHSDARSAENISAGPFGTTRAFWQENACTVGWRNIRTGELSMVDQSAKWEDFRKRRKFAVIVLILSIPWLGLAVFLPRSMPFHDGLVGVFMVVWFVAWVFAMARLLLVRCPRCGAHFSQTRMINLMFLAETCVHCGIQKYSNW
jgi:hypothetical protein